MGVAILKEQPTLEQICKRQFKYEIDSNIDKGVCLLAWEVNQKCTTSLKWPYKFLSTSGYIVILIKRQAHEQKPILQRDKISIQLGQILFGAQYLLLHYKKCKRIYVNNKQYSINIFSFYGDNLDEEVVLRASMTLFVDDLLKYLEFGAGSFCIGALNQCESIKLNSDIKEVINLEDPIYEQAHQHFFIQNQIFLNEKKTLTQSLNSLNKKDFYQNFKHGQIQIPYFNIQKQKPQKIIKNGNKNNDLNQSLPFACQITQINIRGGQKQTKMESGNIDESNMIFGEMQQESQNIQKIEQFVKGLFLGTQKASKNFALLNSHKIKLIVNCSASSCKNWFIQDINYKWIDMPDKLSEQFNIECLIYQVADIVSKVISEPAGVLIHCSGYNPNIDYTGCRSVAILVGILMSVLKLSYTDSLGMLNKQWKIKLPDFMAKQLQNLQNLRKQKPVGFRVYSICSYSENFPKHIVAKYMCEVEKIQNIQGIDEFEKSVFLCMGANSKIISSRECEFKQQYQKYAKDHFKLLSKFQGYTGQCQTQPLSKTFRKQPKIQISDQKILHINPKGKGKSPGFIKNEQIVLKYPILRPVWQKKREDGFYFTIRDKGQKGAEIVMNKGMDWIGYETDKQEFFDRIINCYLAHIPHNQIYILETQQQEQSLFDTSQLNI